MTPKPAAKPDKDKEKLDPRAKRGPEEQAEPASKRPKTKLAIIGGVLALAAVAGIVGGVMLLKKGPASASADTLKKKDAKPPESEDVEELIVEGKAANTKQGTTYSYKFKIHGVLDKADLATVKATIERRKATIEDMVRQSVARLEPKDLDEPELSTLRRTLMHEFEQIFGPGKIKQLLIPEWIKYKVDF